MMKKAIFLVFILVIAVYLTGCGKKQEALEQMQEPMSMEALSAINNTTNASVTVPPTAVASGQQEMSMQGMPQEMSTPGPIVSGVPTEQEIQTALQNAGFYNGAIDGKIGPKTKQAIEKFQRAQGLQADGKVGPKTWVVLSQYLNAAPQAARRKVRR